MTKNDSDLGWVLERPFAHRGLHDNAAGVPENTLPAFVTAAEAGYGIELDVQLTSDGQLIVAHDKDTGRLGDQSLTIADSSLETLRAVHLANTSIGLPTLHEALRTIAGRVPVLIEVKPDLDMKLVGPRLSEALDGYPGRLAVISFDPRVLFWLRRHASGIIRGQSGGSYKNQGIPLVLRPLLKMMLFNLLTRPQLLTYDYSCLPSLTIRFWARLWRLPRIFWTIHDVQEAARIQADKANYIFEGFQPPTLK